MKKTSIAIAIIIIGVAAYAGYQKYESAKEAAAVGSAIREASVRVVNQLSFFKEDRGATYLDAITQADTHVRELQAAIERFQTLEKRRQPDLVSHGEKYLKAAQESVRRAKSMTRGKAELTAARNAIVESVDSLEAFVANPGDEVTKFHSDVARYGSNAAIRRAKSANDEVDASALGLGAALSEMVSLRAIRPKSIPLDAYVTDRDVSGIKIKF